MFGMRMAALVAAVLSTGLIAGVFYAYAMSVMPALARTEDRTLVEVMQKINVVIINPWFMLGFLGTVGFGLLAVVLHLGREQRPVLVWLGIALALNVIAFGVTAACNVPLNDMLAGAGDQGALADPAGLRADFEASWVRWNVVRAVLHTAAFLVLCGALFAAGMVAARAERGDAAAGPGSAATAQFVAGPAARQFR
ncbi:anthrone oxygenase family protein [Nocardia thailandica]|uniref:anthrone oxygenase family protein n=1 Tax=Nocardia thailandica TaxID=257275 RepID=UPI0005B8C098|nr:anthrone oxygenase family protein [Nocardia thailandica]